MEVELLGLGKKIGRILSAYFFGEVGEEDG